MGRTENRLAGGFFCRCDFGDTRQLRFAAFEIFERQYELPDHLVDFLGILAELHPTQLGDDQFEVLNFYLLGDRHGL